MKSLLVTMHFPRSEEVPPTKALVEGLTDAILMALEDGLGQETAEQNVQPIPRMLYESPEETDLEIPGCFDAGYEVLEHEEPEPVIIRRRKDGKLHLEGNGREVLLEVVNWKPDEGRREEVLRMSRDEMVMRILELEAVL